MAEAVSNPPGDGAPQAKKEAQLARKAERKRLRLLARMRLKAKLMKDQLNREIALTDLAAKRGKEEWGCMLKEIKLKEFRIDMEHWGARSELWLEKKDEKIQTFLQYIDESQELVERNFSAHLNQLEYLSNCHKTLHDAATALYEMQAGQMVGDFLEESNRISAIQEKLALDAENVVHSSNVDTKKTLKLHYTRYMDQKFDEACSEIEKRYILRDKTVDYMRKLQNQLLVWMKELEGDMVDVRKTEKFMYFIKRQQNYVKESAKLNRIEEQSRKRILELQQELQDIESLTSKETQSLKMEHEYFMTVRGLIKASITRSKSQTHEKLLLNSSESYCVVNRLKEIVKYGEHLLATAACCGKYKTEKEKVLPMGPEEDPTCDPNYMFELKTNIEKLMDISEVELGVQMAFLKHFWQRCSRVRYHNLMLMVTKQKLEEENEQYRNIVRSLKKSDDVAYILEALIIKPV